jgi:hypothetical protein
VGILWITETGGDKVKRKKAKKAKDKRISGVSEDGNVQMIL